MRIAVATLCSAACAPLGEVTTPNKREYCLRHGYELIVSDFGIFPYEKIAFGRLGVFRDLLRSRDLVLFCGADVLITNPYVRLEDIMEGRKPFVIAKDALGFQTDVMLARNEPRVIEFLGRMVAAEEKYFSAPFVEQSAMAALYPEFRDVIEVVPQRVLNSFDYGTLAAWHTVHPNYRLAVDADGNDGQWQPGDFIFHCPGLPLHSKVAVLKDHLKMIQAENDSGCLIL